MGLEGLKCSKKRRKEIKELIGADTFRFTEDDIRNNGDEVYQRIIRILDNHAGNYHFKEVELIEVKELITVEKRESIKLYNFSVEDDESYIVNGIVVHNCRCTLSKIPENKSWDKERKSFSKLEKYVPRNQRKSKVGITYSGKKYEV